MVSREHIIKVATDLFLTQGVKTITIDRIVKELRTSKRTLYKHFPDKITLLRACLDVYNTKVRAENNTIIDEAENVLEAMGHLLQKIVRRSHQVNPNFFSDIIHYYPGLLHESYKENGNFAHQNMIDLSKWGVDEGVFIKDIDIDVVGKTVLSMLKLMKDNKQFPTTEYSKERLIFAILVPYLRGLCTPKGLEILHVQEELFRVSV